MAEIDYGPVIAAMRGGTPGPPGAPGSKGDPGGLGPLPLLAADLNLNTLTTTGIYTNNTVTGTLANNYPLPGFPGVVSVYPVAQNVSITVQEFRPSHHGRTVLEWARGYYQRLGNSGTWSPWRYVASQRVDTTAGRAIYTYDDVNSREQLVYGDTGWRELPCDNGYVGNVMFRRINYEVYLRLIIAKPVEATTLNGEFLLTTPAGFESDSGAWIYFPVRTSTSPNWATVYRKATLWTIEGSQAVQDSGQIRAEINYTTNKPWPTVLPGVAVVNSGGIIPNN